MSTTPELRVTELDFEGIKENLISFLRAQPEFTDYNFDGAAMSVLLDILSRNTHYNAVLTHLQANEMFLDTAIKRSSVVSIAKTLGYTPRSVTSARATVNLVVTPSGAEEILSLGTTARFSTTANGQSFSFYPERDYVVPLQDGVFTFRDVVLVEGTPLTNTFAVQADTVSGPFVIPARNIDTSTLEVSVLQSSTEIALQNVQLSRDIVDVTGEDLTYWLEETADEQYRIVFGDGVVGKALTVGNIVVASYLASSGPAANGARLFSAPPNLGGSVTIEIVTRAASGSVRETIDSIRFFAPRSNTTRNRAVTVQDYRNLILSSFDKAKAVSVWGGEENVPPIYGKVFITIDPKDGYVITEGDRQYLSNVVLRPRSVLSIQHEFVDPDYLYLSLRVSVQYNPKKTSLSSGQMNIVVTEEIVRFFAEEVSTLDQTFFYSQFIDAVQAVNPAIISVLVDVGLRKNVRPILNVPNNEKVDFLGAIRPGSVRSGRFQTTVDGISKVVHLHDYPDAIPAKATTGKLWVVEDDHVTKVVLGGTIDYVRGVVQLTDLFVSDFLGADPFVTISANPTELSKNVSPKIIRTVDESTEAIAPLPSRNIILSLDTREGDTATSVSPGLIVNTTPFIEKL